LESFQKQTEKLCLETYAKRTKYMKKTCNGNQEQICDKQRDNESPRNESEIQK